MNQTSGLLTDRRRWNLGAPARLCVVAVGGFLFGLLTAHVPSPRDPGDFWVSNLAAPYLVIPVLVGAWRFRARGAAVAGALAAVAAVAGFYNVLMVGNVSSSQLGLPPSTTGLSVVGHAYVNWVQNFVLGDPGGRPWLTVAAVVGAGGGWLGYLWRQHDVRVIGLATALVPVVEALAYVLGVPPFARYDLHPLNLSVWVGEMLLGIVALVVVWRISPRSRARRERPSTVRRSSLSPS